MITGRQIKAARALLGWDAVDLAGKAGLSRETVSNIENGLVQAREASLSLIIQVFDEYRIEFTENQGVRFKSNDVEIFEGAQRFDDFSDFVYEHLKRYGGDVCISAVDEGLFAKHRKDPDVYRRRIKELVDSGRVTWRILATESKFVSSYAQYKWQPQQSATPISFYAFGDCLALISFAREPSPHVILIKAGPFAEAYRNAFNIAWASAKDPSEQSGEQS